MQRIRQMIPEAEKKAFTEDELWAIEGLDVDYVSHLLANPKELREVVRRYGLAKQAAKESKVAEVYSPPRVTEKAKEYGLGAGWSLDLTVRDPLDNQPWDFTKKEHRELCE